MYLSFVVRIARSKYPATVHQVSSISFARLAVTAMARTHTTEATQATAQVNLRIGTSLAESLHNTTEEDVIASISLKRAYRQGSKPVAGEACYQLGLLHERRAETVALRAIEGDTLGAIASPTLEWSDAMLRVIEGDTLGSIAPSELEWADAMRSADACFRDALWAGFPGAAARICRLHKIESWQRRPLYPGDKVRIRGLVSSLGRRLNQREGVAISQVDSSERYAVIIDGIGIKHIRPANLTIIHLYGDCNGLDMRTACSCDGCSVQPHTQ